MSAEEMDITDDSNESDSDSNSGSEMDDAASTIDPDTKATEDVYLPGVALEDGEELVCDKSAYIMYHQAQTSAPCLSFDVISDRLGENRETFPLSAIIVAGTQANQAHVNNVIVMKLSNLHGTKDDDDEELDDEADEGDVEEKHPKMAASMIKHQGCVNRIRVGTLDADTTICACWSELGRINIFNLCSHIDKVNSSSQNQTNSSQSDAPIFTFSGHQKEGFALDWCPTQKGVLASGDCKRDIHIWTPTDGAVGWNVDQRPLVGHTDSVEDLQWSPNERNVLASCSVDKTVRIWDTRAAPKNACMITVEAHQTDVNVISWNRNEPFIVSGGDDGYLHIWDLRKLQDKSPLATFKHHSEPVTTVQWHSSDSAVFASGGSDNQIALWDLSVEKDANEMSNTEIEGLPPQLLFIHQGQTNIKELHWHPQLTGVIISTAESGFNIFRTISV